MSVVGIVTDPANQAATLADAMRVVHSLAVDHSRGRTYLNFAHRQGDTAQAFDPATWQRLLKVRSAVDPHGLLQANHEIS
ncbi:hypothetical protein [Micromonospora zamorensis]|uniref:hypothetical protein n=1 Tax=Micromonospora zamorensis TaxID=709883 RepID=UPI003CEB6E91